MGIDIAIIDSGVNPAHPHVQGEVEGLTVALDSEGRLTTTGGFEDKIGHGTAIAGVIREKNPDARLWAVKIFQNDLSASSKLLFEAVKWAIHENMNVIHLSLGTEREQDRQPLMQLCQSAHKRGIFIIAAARKPDDIIYPAVFDTVFGVYWNPSCEPGSIIFHPNNPIEFGAFGQPRPLPGLDQKRNFRGNSFAAAHVSAKVAQILADNPDADRESMINKLIPCSIADPL